MVKTAIFILTFFGMGHKVSWAGVISIQETDQKKPSQNTSTQIISQTPYYYGSALR